MKNTFRHLLTAAFVAMATFCFWQATAERFEGRAAAPGARASTGHQEDAGEVRAVALTNPRTVSRSVITPIQELRVGMRVVGRNPLDAEAQRGLPGPKPATWRLLRARIEMLPDKFCDIELLRPLDWIREAAGSAPLQAGDTIWLDLPEMHVAGEAEVLAIDPCPAIESDAGELRPLITGTFRHEAKSIVDVHVEGSANPIGCTPAHPFWSETRKDFVAASSLKVDERVLTAYGNAARITSIVPRAGPQVVYGLEIHGQHVYHVGTATLLVHNASVPAPKKPLPPHVQKLIDRGNEAHAELAAKVKQKPGWQSRANANFRQSGMTWLR